jgi:hypothetical protein
VGDFEFLFLDRLGKIMTWTNQIGDLAPQLLRECRSRLTPRGVFAAVGLTLVAITLLVLAAWTDVTSFPQRFCTNLNNIDNCTIKTVDWARWWQGMFTTVSWSIPYIAIGLGMFQIVGDLQQEERQGTLNFLRLSPRSSWGILLGKLFGVPILVYLALAIVLPFQWFVGLMGQVPIGLLLSYTFYLGIDLVCFYSVALLSGLLGARSARQAGQNLATGSLTLSVPLLSFIVVGLLYNYRWTTVWQPFSKLLWDRGFNSSAVYWFGLPLSFPLFAIGVGLLQTAIFLALVWWVLHRCYQTPQNTVLSKVQSYVLVAASQLNFLGYALDPVMNDRGSNTSWMSVLFTSWTLFIIVISNLTPHRQMLIDWMNSRRRPLFLDLLVGEQSPIHLAIAVNLLLFGLPVFPILLSGGLFTAKFSSDPVWFLANVILTLGLSFSLMMVYAALIQLLLSARNSKRGVWTIGIVAFVVTVPLICSWIAMIADSRSVVGRILLLLTPFSPAALTSSDRFLSGLGISWLVVGLEWLLVFGLTYLLARRLKSFERPTS